MLQFTLIQTARGLPQSLLFLCCPLHHVPELTWSNLYDNMKLPKASGTFTLCTNCKHPRLVSVYLLTNPCHQGLASQHLWGAYSFVQSVWIAGTSLKNKLYNTFHMARGMQPQLTTTGAERKRPVWRQFLLREWDRQPYGHRHYTRHTTFSYKSLGDWPISLPPVLLVAHRHNAAASLPVRALLCKTAGRMGRFITPQTVVLPCGNNSRH